MSETQLKVTGNFQAADEDGNQYHVTEYTLFRHTTTSEMAEGESGDGGIIEYKIGNGSPIVKISDTEFEVVKDGTRIHRLS